MKQIKIGMTVYVPNPYTDEVYEGEVTDITPKGDLVIDECYVNSPDEVYLTEDEAMEAGECLLEDLMLENHYAACGGFDPYDM